MINNQLAAKASSVADIQQAAAAVVQDPHG